MSAPPPPPPPSSLNDLHFNTIGRTPSLLDRMSSRPPTSDPDHAMRSRSNSSGRKPDASTSPQRKLSRPSLYQSLAGGDASTDIAQADTAKTQPQPQTPPSSGIFAIARRNPLSTSPQPSVPAPSSSTTAPVSSVKATPTSRAAAAAPLAQASQAPVSPPSASAPATTSHPVPSPSNVAPSIAARSPTAADPAPDAFDADVSMTDVSQIEQSESSAPVQDAINTAPATQATQTQANAPSSGPSQADSPSVPRKDSSSASHVPANPSTSSVQPNSPIAPAVPTPVSASTSLAPPTAASTQSSPALFETLKKRQDGLQQVHNTFKKCARDWATSIQAASTAATAFDAHATTVLARADSARAHADALLASVDAARALADQLRADADVLRTGATTVQDEHAKVRANAARLERWIPLLERWDEESGTRERADVDALNAELVQLENARKAAEERELAERECVRALEDAKKTLQDQLEQARRELLVVGKQLREQRQQRMEASLRNERRKTPPPPPPPPSTSTSTISAPAHPPPSSTQPPPSTQSQSQLWPPSRTQPGSSTMSLANSVRPLTPPPVASPPHRALVPAQTAAGFVPAQTAVGRSTDTERAIHPNYNIMRVKEEPQEADAFAAPPAGMKMNLAGASRAQTQVASAQMPNVSLQPPVTPTSAVAQTPAQIRAPTQSSPPLTTQARALSASSTPFQTRPYSVAPQPLQNAVVPPAPNVAAPPAQTQAMKPPVGAILPPVQTATPSSVLTPAHSHVQPLVSPAAGSQRNAPLKSAALHHASSVAPSPTTRSSPLIIQSEHSVSTAQLPKTITPAAFVNRSPSLREETLVVGDSSLRWLREETVPGGYQDLAPYHTPHLRMSSAETEVSLGETSEKSAPLKNGLTGDASSSATSASLPASLLPPKPAVYTPRGSPDYTDYEPPRRRPQQNSQRREQNRRPDNRESGREVYDAHSQMPAKRQHDGLDDRDDARMQRRRVQDDAQWRRSFSPPGRRGSQYDLPPIRLPDRDERFIPRDVAEGRRADGYHMRPDLSRQDTCRATSQPGPSQQRDGWSVSSSRALPARAFDDPNPSRGPEGTRSASPSGRADVHIPTAAAFDVADARPEFESGERSWREAEPARELYPPPPQTPVSHSDEMPPGTPQPQFSGGRESFMSRVSSQTRGRNMGKGGQQNGKTRGGGHSGQNRGGYGHGGQDAASRGTGNGQSQNQNQNQNRSTSQQRRGNGSSAGRNGRQVNPRASAGGPGSMSLIERIG